TQDQDFHIFESAWAAYYKGLLFLGQAHDEQRSRHTVSSVVAAYYGVFHLGVCAFLCGYRGHPRKYTNALLHAQHGDPAGAVEHIWVRKWLTEQSTQHTSLAPLSSACQTLWNMRTFVNYEPRLPRGGDGGFTLKTR